MPRQNWPSVHDVPSYLEVPSVGHMALSWATIQILATIGAKGTEKTPPMRSCSFFSHLSPSFVCKQIRQQLHTPDAHHVEQGTFCRGGNKHGLTLQRNRTPQKVSASFPLFLRRVPPHAASPRAPLSCPTPLFFFFVFGVHGTEPGNIFFALVSSF